ncbi:MAG: EAL domain-containing protein [Serpentinimonas sp.]|jgi:diguanylate cyclase (GGDEF)-like protein/PAS domain S-box-containing protein|nr:EAL domain-containing protein [Serpentinimonas sp.]
MPKHEPAALAPREDVPAALPLSAELPEAVRLMVAALAHLREAVLITEAQPLQAPGPRIVYANPAFERLSGYGLSELLGSSPRILQGPETDPLALAAIGSALRELRPIRQRLVNYTRTGERYMVEVDIAPMLDASGGCSHFVAVQRDIGAQASLQAQLAEANDRLLRVLKGSNDAAWDWNIPRGTMYLSPRWFEMLGYAHKEIGDEHQPDWWLALVHPDELSYVQSFLARVLAEGPDIYDGEFSMRHRDGHYVTVHCRGYIERDASGVPLRVSGANTDLTQRLQIQRELERETQRLENIIRGTGAATWQLNLLDRSAVYDERWVGMLGGTLADLAPQHTMDMWRERVHPEDLANAEAEFYRHIKGESERYLVEFRMRHNAGHWIWVQSRGSVVRRLPDGRAHLMFGTHIDITPLRQVQDELHRQFQLLQGATAQLPGIVYEFHRNAQGEFRYVYMSEACQALLGVSSHDALQDHRRVWAVIHPEDRAVHAEALQRSLDQLGIYQCHFRVIQRNAYGEPVVRWLESEASPRRLGDGTVAWYGYTQDVTERLQMQQALDAVRSDHEATLAALPDLMLELDDRGFCHKARPPLNDPAARWHEELQGQPLRDVFPAPVTAVYLQALAQAASQGEAHGLSYPLPLQDGQTLWFELSVAPKRGGVSNEKRFVVLARNVTARRQAEERLQELASFDPLTGLHNRRFFMERLAQVLEQQTHGSRWLVLLFVDLDHFKDLNDTLGHQAGDVALQQVALRLSSAVFEGQLLARIGGDEFAVMCANAGGTEAEAALNADGLAQRLLHNLNRAYELDGKEFHLTPSMGISLAAPGVMEMSDLLKRADLALFEAKRAGRNQTRFFDQSIQALVTERVSLDQELRQAITDDQLVLHYQPIVNSSRQLQGYEALVRWQHPQRGLLAPNVFIPLAEQSNLILALGQRVLHLACTQLALWAQDPATACLTLAVNISARQLQEASFVATIMDTLRATGAPASQLKLELTESQLTQNVEDSIEKMRELAALGVGFSLDDFGTGYSSLSYLKRLPLQQLKIDRSFVRDILEDPDDLAIAKMIIQLAQTLNFGVVAEGVETEGQFAYLAGMGCASFQGYWVGKPGPLVGQTPPLQFSEVSP